MTPLDLSACAYQRMFGVGAHDRGPAGGDKIEFVHLAEALHRRSSEDQDVIKVFFEDDICFVNEQTLR
jgi:hypothetical protein